MPRQSRLLSACTALPLLLAALAASPAPAAGASSATVTDPRGDQHHGPAWDTHPAGHATSDLVASRAAVVGHDLVLTAFLARVARRSPHTDVVLSFGGVVEQRTGYTEVEVSVHWGGGEPAEASMDLDRQSVCGRRLTGGRSPLRDRYLVRIPLSCLGGDARAWSGMRTDVLTWTDAARTIGRDDSSREISVDLP